MIFHNTKLINLGETEVSLFLFVLLVVSFSSPRDADNLSLRFENVCISRRGLLFYCTSFWNLHGLSKYYLKLITILYCLIRHSPNFNYSLSSMPNDFAN